MEIDGEVRVQFVNMELQGGESESLTLSSYTDDTVLYIGEAGGQDIKMFNLSKEQLEELYLACGQALAIREEVLDDRQAHFTNKEVREYLES